MLPSSVSPKDPMQGSVQYSLAAAPTTHPTKPHSDFHSHSKVRILGIATILPDDSKLS